MYKSLIIKYGKKIELATYDTDYFRADLYVYFDDKNKRMYSVVDIEKKVINKACANEINFEDWEIMEPDLNIYSEILENSGSELLATSDYRVIDDKSEQAFVESVKVDPDV